MGAILFAGVVFAQGESLRECHPVELCLFLSLIHPAVYIVR